MKIQRKASWKESWEDFKKHLTWNHIKLCISAGILPSLFLYGYTFWIKLLDPLLKANGEPKTPEQALLTLCILAGVLAPIGFIVPLFQLGYLIGKGCRFFKDDITKYLVFDDISYMIRDMPQEQREKFKEILSSYRSKSQLRKDRKKHESLLRRIFT